jgi:ABC-type amino acid transport substrate-binding protein
MVNLCRAVVKNISEQLGAPSLKVTYVAVTAANRFDTIRKNDADLLCEATSITLSRRKLVDFSIPTFVDGAGIVTTVTDLHELKDLARRKVGVVSATNR